MFVIDLKSYLLVNESLYLKKIYFGERDRVQHKNQTFVLSPKDLGRLCPGHSFTFFLHNIIIRSLHIK